MDHVTNEHASEGAEHLQRAARELIGAARSFLDAAEEIVEDRELLHETAEILRNVAADVAAGVRAGGSRRRAGEGEPGEGSDGPARGWASSTSDMNGAGTSNGEEHLDQSAGTSGDGDTTESGGSNRGMRSTRVRRIDVE